MNAPDHALFNETRAAEVLKEQIRVIAGDDEDLLRDMLEGETHLRPLMAAVCEAVGTDEGLISGLKQAENNLAQRRARIEQRIELRRTALMTAMETANLKSFEAPTGTITLKATPPQALILDEAAVPSEYWKPQDPKLDKRAVLAALKEGAAIPGTQLSNGGTTLQIRR
jgi:hypothetical protein